MLHGDLHTGSVMLTETDTRVIDPEFAFMGPMGFDTGAVIANFLLSYFSQDGHEERPGARDAYRDWILATTEEIWTLVRSEVPRPTGSRIRPAMPIRADLFQGPLGAARLAAERNAYMQAPVARHRRLCRRQDDPPHPWPCPQYRSRLDQGSEIARRLRSPRTCCSPAT